VRRPRMVAAASRASGKPQFEQVRFEGQSGDGPPRMTPARPRPPRRPPGRAKQPAPAHEHGHDDHRGGIVSRRRTLFARAPPSKRAAAHAAGAP
jgi:hypothetical protein